MRTVIVALKNTAEDQVRSLICAAKNIRGGEISLWAFSDVCECYGHLPIDKMMVIPSANLRLPEEYQEVLLRLWEKEAPELTLLASCILGDGIAIRLASLTKAVCVLNLLDITRAGEGFRVVRRAYSCYLHAEYYLKAPCVCSLAADLWKPDLGSGRPEKKCVAARTVNLSWCEGYTETLGQQEEKLTDFDVVLVAGYGMGDKETVARLEALGRYLQAGVGGTRPVVLSGWLSREKMIGLSGVQIAPKICVALGVSGCPPFMKGVERSGRLIAVNQDPNAPIFRYSDVGIVGDCRAVLNELLALADIKYGKE